MVVDYELSGAIIEGDRFGPIVNLIVSITVVAFARVPLQSHAPVTGARWGYTSAKFLSRGLHCSSLRVREPRGTRLEASLNFDGCRGPPAANGSWKRDGEQQHKGVCCRFGIVVRPRNA